MGVDFKKAHTAGVERIAAWADLLDQINVFPIADGDTGRNLIISLTPLRQLNNSQEMNTRMLLMSARGNSGNIAARFFSEFIKADSLDALSEAAKQGRDSAWQAVNNPIPGTMLTVYDTLVEILSSRENNFDKQWILRILNHLEGAVNSTVTLLPKLKEANVVDAGALGMFIFFEGFFNTIGQIDEYCDISEIFKDKLHISSSFHEDSTSGYCVDTILKIDENSENTINRLSGMGESVVVIQNKDYLKVHLHTDNKEAVRKEMESCGRVVHWTDDNLSTQVEDFNESAEECAIHIMTDAAGSVTREDAQKLGITLLDSYITVRYKCLPETHFDSTEIYEAMSKGIKVSSSQASTFERHQHYQSVLSLYPRVLYLCVGSAFTGNYDIAMEWKRKNDPDNRLTVIDSCAASGRLGVIAIATARQSRISSEPHKVVEFAQRAVKTCQEYVFLDKLQYLAAGGRLSKTSAFFGDMLHMKPIVSPVAEGAKKVGIARNKEDQLKFLLKKLEENLAHDSKALIMIEYSDNRTWVSDVVKSTIFKRYPDAEFIIQPLSLTTGVHSGPGTWAVAFLPE